MTREEAIKRLKEIDIRDALQEDYDALDMAIKALEQCEVWDGIHGQVVAPKGTFDRIWEDAEKEEQEPKTEWIPVSERKAEFPCIATDEYGNYPFIPSGVVTINDCCYDAKNFRFDIDEFLKGEEVTLDGEKAYLLPRKIVAWMPLPEPYKESEEMK